ncbi:hypothetical protein GC197_18160 [bacterium]|nr:hypothetical protein [bacterium]
MNLIVLNCQQCGAPLEIPVGLTHVTCAHCGAALVVRQQGSIYFTEKIKSLEKHTGRMQSEIDQLKRDQAIDQFEKSWKEKTSSDSLPQKDDYILPMVGAIALGIITLAFLPLSGGGLMILLALPLAILVFMNIGDSILSWNDYHQYVAERNRLLKVDEADKRFGPNRY